MLNNTSKRENAGKIPMCGNTAKRKYAKTKPNMQSRKTPCLALTHIRY
jgi:hypothetical protein